MIAKRIARDKATSNFARLGKYVVDARGGIDPTSWTRTADYILDLGHDGAKVGGVRVTNCGADDPALATQEILLTQGMNKRSKADKSYHLVFSFPAGERPTLNVLHAIEDHLVNAIGLGNHQRISAVHTDTDYLHVHVAINKVHPTTHRNVEPFYDKQRLMEACDHLEIRHGLTRTNHGQTLANPNTPANPRIDSHDRFADYDYTHPDHVAALRESYRAALAGEYAPESGDGLRDMPGSGLVSDEQIAEMLLSGDATRILGQRGYQPNHRVRWPRDGAGLSSEAEKQIAGSPPGRPGDMEAHAGRDSLLGWTRRVVAPELRNASSWDDIHHTLDKYGLSITPHGAGLIVESVDGVRIKASQIDRTLSIGALTRRFGAYVPPKGRSGHSGQRYGQLPKHPHASTAALFKQYQAVRAIAQRDRIVAQQNITAKHSRSDRELADWYKKRRLAIRLDPTLKGPFKKLAYGQLAREKSADLDSRKGLARTHRTQVMAKLALPTWQAWLVEEAQRGNGDALAVLRSRVAKQRRSSADWLRAGDPDAARDVILRSAQQRTDKNGVVHYTAKDGGTLRDEKHGIRVATRSDAAALLALTLASQRYAGQALVVDGSDAFRAQLIATAAANRLNITFADAAMEATRKALMAPAETPAPTAQMPITPMPSRPEENRAVPSEAATVGEQKPSDESPSKSGEKPMDAVDELIAERNLQRAKNSTIVHHSRWTPDAAGEAIYRGRRQLKDGSEAVLLQRGETMHVLPVTSAQAAKASTLRIGSTIKTDDRGRFVGMQRSKGR